MTWPCPSIGVGLLYRKGYFRQAIDADGHQEHDYPDYDLSRLPLGRVQDRGWPAADGQVELPGRDLHVAVWLAQVGRVPVLLLDTDLPENADADRPITNILYVRGREMRLHQELVLGIGGVRAIRELGLEPGGLAPERGPLRVPARRACPRVRRRRRRRSTTRGPPSVATASSRSTRRSRPATSASRRTSCGVWRVRCSRTGGVPVERVLELGLGVDGDADQFDMTAFSLRLTRGANAVSKLHAETANATWQGIVDHEILGITNGIHGPTWIGEPIAELLEAPRRRPGRSRCEE